jgi:hypothetical protein
MPFQGINVSSNLVEDDMLIVYGMVLCLVPPPLEENLVLGLSLILAFLMSCRSWEIFFQGGVVDIYSLSELRLGVLFVVEGLKNWVVRILLQMVIVPLLILWCVCGEGLEVLDIGSFLFLNTLVVGSLALLVEVLRGSIVVKMLILFPMVFSCFSMNLFLVVSLLLMVLMSVYSIRKW